VLLSLLSTSRSYSISTLWRSQSQVRIGKTRGNATARRARNKAQLQQVWLVHIFNRLRVLARTRGKCIQPHRPAIELLYNGEQQVSISLVKSDLIYLQRIERRLCTSR